MTEKNRLEQLPIYENKTEFTFFLQRNLGGDV